MQRSRGLAERVGLRLTAMIATSTGDFRNFLNQDLNQVLVTLLIAALLAIFRYLIGLVTTQRASVVYYKTNKASDVLGNQLVYTQTVIIQNLGNQMAKQLEILHNWPPDSFKCIVVPLRKCTPFALHGGQAAIDIGQIHPGETIFVTYIYGTPPNEEPLFNSLTVEGRKSRERSFPLAPRYDPRMTRVLNIFGALFLIYLILKIVVALWHL